MAKTQEASLQCFCQRKRSDSTVFCFFGHICPKEYKQKQAFNENTEYSVTETKFIYRLTSPVNVFLACLFTYLLYKHCCYSFRSDLLTSLKQQPPTSQTSQLAATTKKATKSILIKIATAFIHLNFYKSFPAFNNDPCSGKGQKHFSPYDMGYLIE